MKKVLQFITGVALFAAIVFAFTQVSNVYAQSTGLRINPRADVTARPGETQTGSLLIANLNRNIPITVDLSVIDFRSEGQTGTPTPILEENAPQTPWSLKPFLTTPQQVSLEAGETKYVPYSVRIPEGQGAGSYYSAIKYDPRPTNEADSAVVISGAPMQLVFVTVPGRATELMHMEKFGAYSVKPGQTDGRFQSLFITRQPERLAYLLRNAGNVAENPTGSVIIKNLFGKQVHVIDNANPKGNLALIDQTRRFEVCIEAEETEVEQDGRTTTLETCKSPGFWPGIYRAELNLFYGINGSSTQEINARATFWYLPWWSIAVIVAFLAIVAFVIYKVRQSLIGRKSHRRSKR